MARPYLLAETNYRNVLNTNYRLAVLPWGATEAHNYHLPYATDNYQVEHVAHEAARQAWAAGSRVLVLPNIPFGINTGQLDVPLCMNLNPTTQLAILKDTVDSLQRAEVDKLLILNGHGGNHFKNMVRELSFHFPKFFVCWANWFQAVDWRHYFDEPGDHAGEMETSAILHIAPELVRPLSEAGNGAAKRFKIKGFREGWVSAQRQWTQVTEDTGVGNPQAATAEKGATYLRACAQKLAELMTDLANTSNADLYE